MTFEELRDQISAEMPPGWGWELSHRYNSTDPREDWTLDWWNTETDEYPDEPYAPTPEALLAAWRKMKGKLSHEQASTNGNRKGGAIR